MGRNNHRRQRPFTVWLLIFQHIFLGVNAIAAGAAFMIAPDGHLIQMPLSNLERSPFTNYFIPGFLLFTFVGVYPFLVAYSLWRQPTWRWPDHINPFKQYHWSWAGSIAAGLILMIWIIVQIQWINIHILHTIFFIWGLLILVVTIAPPVRLYSLRKP